MLNSLNFMSKHNNDNETFNQSDSQLQIAKRT